MSSDNIEWSLVTDVVVVGAGGAGLVSAINAHDQGARVEILEKMPQVGGITVLAGGGLKAAYDYDAAVSYLTHTQGGRVGQKLVEAFAQGLVELPAYLEKLAKVNGSVIGARADAHEGIYDFPGRETLFSINVSETPGFTGYDWAHTGNRLDGQRFFKVLLDNVLSRNISIRTNAPVQTLIQDVSGEVIGVWAEIAGKRVAIKALRGVVLASGGFEFNEKLKREYFETPKVYAMGNPGNTGDGILMSQKAGAALWHMWHFHGSYGFKFDDYDSAFRIAPSGARNSNRPISWIVLDKTGKRFMNELHPAAQDTAARALGLFDPDVVDFERIPATMVFDEDGRKLGRIANPLTANAKDRYDWSEDNSAEVERGWIRKYDTLEQLAKGEGWDPAALKATVDRWNGIVENHRDTDFRRPAGTQRKIQTAPFYAVHVWPLLTNTQGGPEHDELQRVLDPYGKPIPRLYAVGELGSFFGHIYLLGGNLSEIIISGRIAGEDAANLKPWEAERPSSGRRPLSVVQASA